MSARSFWRDVLRHLRGEGFAAGGEVGPFVPVGLLHGGEAMVPDGRGGLVHVGPDGHTTAWHAFRARERRRVMRRIARARVRWPQA